MLSGYAISEAELERFLCAIGATAWRMIDCWIGDRYCIVEAIGADGETHGYRSHDIRMLAARAC